MAATASARSLEQAAPAYHEEPLHAVEYAPRVARRTRPMASQRGRLARLFIVFVVCLAVLAAGRVAMSFAVVQKSVATDAITTQERQLAAENAQLTEELARLGSTVRISAIAKDELGLVDATHVRYLAAAKGRAAKADKEP